MNFSILFTTLFIFLSHFTFSNESKTSAPPCNKPAAVTIKSTPAITDTGSNKSITVCSGIGVTLAGEYISGSDINNESYQYSWYKKGTTPIYVNSSIVAAKSLTSADAGTWILRVEDGSAGTASCYTEDSVKFIVTPTPSAPTATSPYDFCEGGTSPIWAATANVGNVLQWYSNATGGISSATSPAIPNTPAGLKEVWVSQKYSFAPGCESPRTKIDVTVNPMPTVSITGSGNICPGTFTSLKAIPSGLSYMWTNGVGIPLGMSDTYLAISEDTYTVEVTDLNGCKNIAKKSTFEINVSATILSSPSSNACEGDTIKLIAIENADTYSWSRDGVSVGTGRAIAAIEAGLYEVELTFNTIPRETCTASDTKSLYFYPQSSPECNTVAGVNQINSNSLFVTPNPSAGLFNLNLPPSNGEAVKLNIYNTLGGLVYSKTVSPHSNSSNLIDLQNSPSGVYLLEIETNDGIAVKRIIKK